MTKRDCLAVLLDAEAATGAKYAAWKAFVDSELSKGGVWTRAARRDAVGSTFETLRSGLDEQEAARLRRGLDDALSLASAQDQAAFARALCSLGALGAGSRIRVVIEGQEEEFELVKQNRTRFMAKPLNPERGKKGLNGPWLIPAWCFAGVA
jgi:hypothetical protein